MDEAGEVQPGPVSDAPVIVGYQMAAPIGRGGFATVYRATQTVVGGPVAIKVINATETEPDVLLRFERESQAMGALRGHPHIVTVLDAGHTADDRPYIVMELVESGSLHGELVRRGRAGEGPMPVDRVLDIGVKVASAVAAAHGRGILHRDLKPGNILLSDYGEPLLTDFGIARLADHDASIVGQVLSAGFTAPEIIHGGQPTVASDIFSLGCTLHTLLAGTSPFRRPDDAGLLPSLNRTVAEPAPDLRSHGVPSAVCDVLDQALAKAPEDRFDDVAAMGRALQAVQAKLGLPVSSAPLLPMSAVVAPTDTEASTVMVAGDLADHLTDPAQDDGDQPDTVLPPANRRAPSARARPSSMVIGVVLLGLVGTVAAVWVLSGTGRTTPSKAVAQLSAGGALVSGPFDRRNPIVRGPADVELRTDAPEAQALAGFYGRWAGAINTLELEAAYDLYTREYQEATPFQQFSIDWAAPEVRSLTVLQVTPSGRRLMVDLEYVTTSFVDENPADSCLRRRVTHTLLPADRGFRIAEDGPEEPPQTC